MRFFNRKDAIFVHPDDTRYTHLLGSSAHIASTAFSQRETIEVPILADELVDPAKGSGAVMCCTVGDSSPGDEVMERLLFC